MKVPVYFLHAEFDLRNLVDGDAPDRDCVHTVGPPKPLPPQVGSLHNPKTFEKRLIHEAILLRLGDSVPENDALHLHEAEVELCLWVRLWNSSAGIPMASCDMCKILSTIFWEVNLTSCDRTGAGLSRAGFTGSGRPGLGGASGPRRRRPANMGRWDCSLGWGDYNKIEMQCYFI